MYEELKAWANKWGIKYFEERFGDTLYLNFEGKIYLNAVCGKGMVYFAYNLQDGTSKWGGENE
jgi:hypothetical protein